LTIEAYRIAGNFWGRKLTQISRGFVAICESFLHEIWGRGGLSRGKSEQSVKVFSAKIIFSPIHNKFLPRKFPAIRYHPTTTGHTRKRTSV